ncbi:hypothetical protein [Candidatus Magnetaquicoccus inordinatus]|uniref:hypothetical protein n=1 Tax=Candidatus Magnetaquicoccus inordinatus TaxID=2496818 RepID=UPI00102CD216|nr:hypothetical protein [Candidatus Magnetaquicoccus inordinatus]
MSKNNGKESSKSSQDNGKGNGKKHHPISSKKHIAIPIREEDTVTLNATIAIQSPNVERQAPEVIIAKAPTKSRAQRKKSQNKRLDPITVQADTGLAAAPSSPAL